MKYLLLLAASILLSAVVYSQGCVANYVEPTFQLQKTDLSCSGNDGVVEVINQSGGVGPFTYKLVETNTVNNTGLFTNLAGRTYTVELRDACGTVRTRQVTLVEWSFSFTYTVSKTNACSDGQIRFTPTPAGASYTYGVEVNGDTTWSSSPTVNIKLYKKMTLLVKDACGTIKSQVWYSPNELLPYIKELQHRLQCDKFDIFPSFFGFNAPQVCLYELGTNRLVQCKQAPAGTYTGGYQTNFFDIPWGKYYVIVQDACYRDSMFHPDMRSAGGSELNPYNWDCTTFTMHVDGMEDTVCLYNAATNQLISCKGQDTVSINPRTGTRWPSGAVWENLPYGCYYAWIYDPCTDSTFKIDSCVHYPFSSYTNAFPGCSLNQTTVQMTFSPEAKKPFSINVYNWDGSLNASLTSNYYDNYVPITPDSLNRKLKIISKDACGIADTTEVAPSPTKLQKNVSVYNKCPGLSGDGGSGDITVFATTNSSVRPVPQIIKKNGVDTLVNYSYNAGSDFEFPNLLTGQYIIKYTFSSCSSLVIYDTLEIKDYAYPGQHLDTAIQCGGNQFTFTFPIVGGLSPYTFQIIENTPSLPSLVSAVQSDSTFVIGNGQHYTNVKVRAIDRCGNSTIGDISVQPINGCSTLPVDTIHGNPVVGNWLKVYPNPSSRQFTVSISQKKKTDYRLEIINVSGTRVYERQLSAVDRQDVIVNDRFAPGLYIIKVTDLQTGKTSVFKQIVQ